MHALNTHQHLKQRLRNLLHSLLIMGAMVLLLGLAAQVVLGPYGWFLVLGILSALLMGMRFSPHMLMRFYQARPLHEHEAPDLYSVLNILCQRAGMQYIPTLYYLPSPVATAFTTGRHNDAVIALSDALLRRLNLYEMAAVLGHELSHVRHRDTWVMSLADIISRLVNFLAFYGLVVIFLLMPVMLLKGEPLPLLAIVILALSPNLTMLLQLALSRAREFDADLGSVELTHDPKSMMHALQKIEDVPIPWYARILRPAQRDPIPSLLRSHPSLEERIQRLSKITPPEPPRPVMLEKGEHELPGHLVTVRRIPRRHWHGLWY